MHIYKSSDIQEYCKHQLTEMKEIGMSTEPSKLIPLHRVLIMITIQQTKDELQFEQYVKVTQGWLTLQRFLLPLKAIAAFDCFVSSEMP